MLTPSLAIALARPNDEVESFLSIKSDVVHSRMRRVLAQTFPEKAMRERESHIQRYFNLLVVSLHEAAEAGPQNRASWYEFVTFDVIGTQKVIPN